MKQKPKSLSSRRLAATYVAVAEGKVAGDEGTSHRHVFAGKVKAKIFADAKRYARRSLAPGVIVTLRKDTETGGIIERVRLEVRSPHDSRSRGAVVWRQAFGT